MDKFHKKVLKDIPNFSRYANPELKKWFEENTIQNANGLYTLKNIHKLKESKFDITRFDEFIKLVSLYSFCLMDLGITPLEVDYDLLVKITHQYLKPITLEKAKVYAETLRVLNIGELFRNKKEEEGRK